MTLVLDAGALIAMPALVLIAKDGDTIATSDAGDLQSLPALPAASSI